MTASVIAIERTGLITAVGSTAPQSCAALRAKVNRPTQTRFMASGDDWIMAHQVTLELPWRGLAKLAKMAALAIDEALQGVPRVRWAAMPMLLCVAERERPGRLDGLDDRLFDLVETELGVRFGPHSSIVTQGRVGVPVALAQARELILGGKVERVLVVAVDSLLSWSTLSHYGRNDRLLTPDNSNGFVPGEAAGALCVGAPTARAAQLLVTGIGFGRETAHIGAGMPLRGDGLSAAIKAAVADAGCAIEDLDFRITDIGGEQYYFKEAALALSRTMRRLKPEFDLWHPAECIGEVGAAAGVAIAALADQACRKQFAPGPAVLAHMANDAGERAALSLQYRASE